MAATPIDVDVPVGFATLYPPHRASELASKEVREASRRKCPRVSLQAAMNRALTLVPTRVRRGTKSLCRGFGGVPQFNPPPRVGVRGLKQGHETAASARRQPLRQKSQAVPQDPPIMEIVWI